MYLWRLKWEAYLLYYIAQCNIYVQLLLHGEIAENCTVLYYKYMQKNNIIIGLNIKKFRQLKGYSQEALALESGLSQGYINQLENAKRNYTQKSIERIASALSISVGELFKIEDSGLDNREKKPPRSIKNSVYKKDLSLLLKGLPDHIIEHYLSLLRLEKELLKRPNKS